MKTAELTGAHLDYWVAKAEGFQVLSTKPGGRSGLLVWDGGALLSVANEAGYRPSTDWAQGGPIIERESISVGKRVDMPAGPRQWDAFIDSTFSPQGRSPHAWWGSTPLIAAMRAYVASKFGDEVSD